MRAQETPGLKREARAASDAVVPRLITDFKAEWRRGYELCGDPLPLYKIARLGGINTLRATLLAAGIAAGENAAVAAAEPVAARALL